jgi:SAM-dependent methyltransferase
MTSEKLPADSARKLAESAHTAIDDVHLTPPYTVLALVGKKVIRPGGRQSTEEIFRLADLRPGLRVLEVGCGVGTTAIEIAQRFDCDVTAIDIDNVMLDRARANVHAAGVDRKVTLREADVETLPFDEESFDRVIIEAVLSFVDQPRAVRQVLRVCREGGRVVDHEFMWLQQPPAEILHRFQTEICPRAHWDDWQELYRSAGLRDVEAVSGVSKLLTPPGLVRDEGFARTFAIVGRLIANRHYRRRIIALMRMMRTVYPYLRWTVVGGTKAS